jgi:isochorismate hydrolase
VPKFEVDASLAMTTEVPERKFTMWTQPCDANRWLSGSGKVDRRTSMLFLAAGAAFLMQGDNAKAHPPTPAPAAEVPRPSTGTAITSAHVQTGIDRDRCCGTIIDVQRFFLSHVSKHRRFALEKNMRNFARLLGYFQIPIVVTLEKPVDRKGSLPMEIDNSLGDGARTFEKEFFDLSRERKIRNHLAHLKKKQVIVVGCETDICVLESCLGLLHLGYEVYVVEELTFSSWPDTDQAIAQMKVRGAVFVSYKTLYHELIDSADDMIGTFGPFPDDLPDSALS